MKHAAFRLYRAAEDRWHWLLVRDDGSVVADSGDEFESRDAAAEGVKTAKAQALEAELIDFGTAAFQLYETDGE